MILDAKTRQQYATSTGHQDRRRSRRSDRDRPSDLVGNIVSTLPNGHVTVSIGQGPALEASCVHIPGWIPANGHRVTVTRVAGYLHVTGAIAGGNGQPATDRLGVS